MSGLNRRGGNPREERREKNGGVGGGGGGGAGRKGSSLFGMREKENEGEFESGKAVGRDCDQSHLLHCPGN